MGKLCGLASENKVWLSLGGAHEKIERKSDSEERERIGNAHILIDDNGVIKEVCTRGKALSCL